MIAPDNGELSGLSTPSLVVDAGAMDRNIAVMGDFARRKGVALRPHAKTHKSTEIAARQIRAGAAGIACATVAEMDAMSAAGIPGLLLTAPIAGRVAAERLASVHRRSPLGMVCDHPDQIEAMLAVLHDDDPPLTMLVDTDIGHRRTGVVSQQEGVILANRIAASNRLAFGGLQGFAGHAQHILPAAERETAARAAATVLARQRDALLSAGLACPLVTGSGTGTYFLDALAPYTELQVGSYVFMDADYARLEPFPGEPRFAQSLYVLATVVSANRQGQVTVDAGTKAFAVNGPPPHILLGVPQGSSYAFAGDEHGIVTLPAGSDVPPLGARLLLSATHCDPTVNLYAAIHVIGGGWHEEWSVTGRR